VARKGANRPIFEGNMPPKKCTPQIGADIGAITGILLSYEKPLYLKTVKSPEYIFWDWIFSIL
jgi:hypothetical protein